MKIVLLLGLMAMVAMTAAVERRKVDQIEANELQDFGNDERDKRYLSSSSSNIHASRTSLYGLGTKLGVRQMTHNTLTKGYGGLRKNYPIPGSRLAHTTNRKIFDAGIRGPLGRVGINGDKYNSRFGLTDEK